ncbi:MAG: hypothetical protein N3E49_07640 [Bacteroidia bacterium]|nr:hypothetical protein [Bacteroidia bacterium]
MRRARLLHSAESVEVLHIDNQARIATIRRYGFEQSISLEQLVMEASEENDCLLAPLSSPLNHETELELHPRLLDHAAELRLLHGSGTRCFYALYLMTPQKTLMPLIRGLFGMGEGASAIVDMSAYPPPWRLLLQRLDVPDSSVLEPPSLRTSEITIRLSMLTRGEAQKLPIEVKSSYGAPELIPSKESTGTVKAGPQIDLHIEVLAPHLRTASPEAIYAYQLSCMKRYLYACEAAGQASAIVIHGVGKKRLQAALLDFCQEQGWKAEVLLMPPYLGGASRVYFTLG